MANIRTIRRQIRGVGNIAKITQAMQMIAASKMKRAQERGIAGRPYAQKIQQVIADLAALPATDSRQPLLRTRPINKIAIIHITPDRGLCGGLVANLNRLTGGYILEQQKPVSIIAVGHRGDDFMHRNHRDVIAEFSNLGDRPGWLDTLPISRIIIDEYTKGTFDLVYIAYAQFVSTVNQRPILQQVLPIVPAQIPRAQNVPYIYEPNSAAVLGNLLPRFVEMEVYQAILESIASEQSARMVAMKNATDNAHELIQELTLKYNKARQESITKELLDIVAGAEALS